MSTQNRFDEIMKSARRQAPSLVLFSLLANILLLTSSIYMLQIFDRVLASGSIDTLIWLTAIALGAIVVYGFLEHSRKLILSRIGSWIDLQVSPFVIRHAIRAKLAFGSTKAGLSDVSDVRTFVAGEAVIAFLDAPWVPVFIALIWLLHPVLGTIAVIGALALFGVAVLNDAVTRRGQQAFNLAVRESRLAAMQYIDHAETVSALGMTRDLILRWMRGLAASELAGRRVSDVTTAMQSFSRALRIILQIMILGVGAWLVLSAELTAGGMIAASIILSRALSPVERAISAWRSYVAFRSAATRLSALFAATSSDAAGFRLPTPSGQLSLEAVHFVPPGSKEPVVKKIDLRLSPGAVCGIIGPSGSGKSTLCKLIVGAWRPTLGSVSLDGMEVHKWPSDQLGRSIGYLPQQVELFDGTIAQNIARMSDATEAEILAASRLAGAHEMIVGLPQAYDTQVGPHGSLLSGGQKQRVGLARALFREPPLVVLDEPSSNLDGEGELGLMRAIDELKARRHTIVIVAHQPRIVRAADTILAMRAGSMFALGPRDEVLRSMLTVRDGNAPTKVAGVR